MQIIVASIAHPGMWTSQEWLESEKMGLPYFTLLIENQLFVINVYERDFFVMRNELHELVNWFVSLIRQRTADSYQSAMTLKNYLLQVLPAEVINYFEEQNLKYLLGGYSLDTDGEDDELLYLNL
ncbi:MAG: hypothetical protein Q8P32_01115 [Candidatus Komeilibacteria bacterium]|nr:hypothetical protein [Candidatus Komeilibacteria bacterium]